MMFALRRLRVVARGGILNMGSKYYDPRDGGDEVGVGVCGILRYLWLSGHEWCK